MNDLRCPECSASLTTPPHCPACGLLLAGPDAGRLWELDGELHVLDRQRAHLVLERSMVLTRLRAATSRPRAVPVPEPEPAESSPAQVQGTLLGLGALLLAVAGVVFAAVTYRTLGTTGRALVLLALTAAALVAPGRLRGRGLGDSAEALGAVALVLALLDAWSVRRAGFGAAVETPLYWAGATAVLAGLVAGYDALVPLRVTRLAAVLLAQAPLVLLLQALDLTLAQNALALGALAAADLAGGRLLAGRTRPAGVRLATGCAAVALLLATAQSVASLADGDRAGALGLLAVAAVLAAGSAGSRTDRWRAVLTVPVVPLVAAAAYGLARLSIAGQLRPLVLLAVSLAGLTTATLLPTTRRPGPVAGALLVALVALAGQAVPVVHATAGPLAWAGAAWTRSLTTSSDARAVIGPDLSWSGGLVTLVVLLGAAAAVAAAGALLDRLGEARLPAGLLLVPAGPVLPLAVGASYPVALGLGLLLAALAVGAARAADDRFRPALLASAAAWTAVTVAWSLADRDATLAVLAAAAALAVVGALQLPAAATVAALLVGAEVVAGCAAGGLSADRAGAALLPLAAVTLLASLLARRVPLEAAAGLLAATATLLAATDPGWLSWALAADGLLALAVALRPDRRHLAVAGALLLSSSSWVRLGQAHVRDPEPYVLPLAAFALLFGHLRRRAQPGTGSFAAYGSGLSLLLVPSLLAVFTDAVPLRALLLLPAAGLVVLAGVHERLRAPLVVGGGVLAVDALQLLAPYASALPRWSLLALVGTVLVVLGATYEQRRRDLDVLRSRYDALA